MKRIIRSSNYASTIAKKLPNLFVDWSKTSSSHIQRQEFENEEQMAEEILYGAYDLIIDFLEDTFDDAEVSLEENGDDFHIETYFSGNDYYAVLSYQDAYDYMNKNTSLEDAAIYVAHRYFEKIR